MQWPEFAALWGPAVPIFLVLMWFLKSVVVREVRGGFRILAKSVDAQTAVFERGQTEQKNEMRKVRKQLKKVKKRCGRCDCPKVTKTKPLTKR